MVNVPVLSKQTTRHPPHRFHSRHFLDNDTATGRSFRLQGHGDGAHQGKTFRDGSNRQTDRRRYNVNEPGVRVKEVCEHADDEDEYSDPTVSLCAATSGCRTAKESCWCTGSP